MLLELHRVVEEQHGELMDEVKRLGRYQRSMNEEPADVAAQGDGRSSVC
jgi:hypothetical protein